MIHSDARRAGNRPLVQNGERGYALLIVLVFAAIIAISLYKEMPVVTFESQRQKEQLLIDRGNEYAQGVKLFVRKTGQYPPSLDALENTNRMRFLRKRFKDPFTGKDDWRLLHAGPGGLIIDSKVNPVGTNGANGTNNPGSPNGTPPGNTGFGSQNASNAGFGASNNNTSNNNGAANSAFGGFNSGPSMNNTNANAANPQAGAGSQNAGGSGGSNSASGASSGGFGGYLSALNSNNSNGNAASGNPLAPSGALMRQRAAAIATNGAPNAAQSGGSPMPGNAGSSPSDQSANLSGPNASDPNGQNGPAIQVRSGQTSPVANGQNTALNNQSGPFSNRAPSGTNTSGGLSSFNASSRMGAMQGGMIAGVASKSSGTSIKTVNDQDRYQLWEFVYDASKDAARQRAGAINQTGAAAGTGSPGMTQGTAQSSSAFGNSGFGGGNASFGNQSNGAFGGNSNSNGSGFGNSNSGFGNSNRGFGNSNNGFGNSSSGFGNSNSGFGSSNSGTSSNNGWSNNSSNTNSQTTGTSMTGRSQQQY